MTACEAIEYSNERDAPVWSCAQSVEDEWQRIARYESLLNFGLNFDRTYSTIGEMIETLLQQHTITSSEAEIIVLKPDVCRERSGNELLFELKRLSGLSWAQIASLVGVSRRAIHNWAAGSKINLTNHQCLGDLVTFLRYIDRGNSEQNKALILSPIDGGATVFDLMKAGGDLNSVKENVGKGEGRPDLVAQVKMESLAQRAPKSFAQEIEELGAIELFEEKEPIIISKPSYRRSKKRRTE